MRIILILFRLFYLKLDSGQDNYILKNPCEFIVSGTSTLHNWNMKYDASDSFAVIKIENQKFINISSFEINLVAKNLKSKDGPMDKNAYKALKTDLFPEINFKLHKMDNIKYENETILISANGMLSLPASKIQFNYMSRLKFKKT